MAFRWTDAKCGRAFSLLDRSIIGVENNGSQVPGIWSTLSKSAQALFPVLMRHTSESGECFPGEDRLAAMSGLTEKTVRAASLELAAAGLVGIRRIISRTGRRIKLYSITHHGAQGADAISLPHILIDGGGWSCLTPAAKSLSLAFRYFASPRPDLDPEEEQWLDGDDFTDYLGRRDFDFCNAEPAILREFAGLGHSVYREAIRSLEEHHFIAPHDELYWRVFVWPPMIKKVAYLNSKLDGVKW